MNKLSCVFLVSFIGAAFGAALSPEFSDWQSKIVGGSEASTGQFPYIVSLRSAANAHFCGGWIHSSRWIVSVAHCTVGRTTANTNVALGAHTNTDGTIYATSRIVNHPNYNANTINNDISCLETANSIVFNERVTTIPLGNVHVGGGVPAIVKGWGVTTQGGTASPVLLYLNTYTMTNEECRSGLGAIIGRLVFDNKICSGNPVGQGPCQGDSGSPVTVGNSVAGAVSWGIGCANGNPDVNERVFSHLTWLNQIMV